MSPHIDNRKFDEFGPKCLILVEKVDVARKGWKLLNKSKKVGKVEKSKKKVQKVNLSLLKPPKSRKN